MTLREFIRSMYGENDLGHQVSARLAGLPLNKNISHLTDHEIMILALITKPRTRLTLTIMDAMKQIQSQS